jgi:cell division protein FtsQ
MARLVSLAAARAQPLRPALRRPVLRRPARRTALALLASVAALGLAYVVARETPLFAVGELEISGAPADVRRDVRAALRDLHGTSLVKVDTAGVEGKLRGLPSVLDASVDRSFPHALRVSIVPEEPLAVIWNREAAWIVSRRGRVIRPVDRGTRVPVPRIWSASATGLVPGNRLVEAQSRLALMALAAVPDDFPVKVRAARGGDSGLRFVLGSGTELRLGTTDDLQVKLAAAGAVLGTMSRSERRGLEYLDVSLPQRPVGLEKS